MSRTPRIKGRDLAFSCYEREARERAWVVAAKLGNCPLDTFLRLRRPQRACALYVRRHRPFYPLVSDPPAARGGGAYSVTVGGVAGWMVGATKDMKDGRDVSHRHSLKD